MSHTLLDTLVSSRGAASCTRLLLAGKLAQQAAPARPPAAVGQPSIAADVLALFSPWFSAGVTGLLVTMPQSFWTVVEGPPEVVLALARGLALDVARPGARLASVRVIAHIEDCPSRAFGVFASRALVPPSESLGFAGVASEVEEAHPVAVAAPVYRAVMAAAAAAALEPFAATLPSDERTCALAAASKVRFLCWFGVCVCGCFAQSSAAVAGRAFPSPATWAFFVCWCAAGLITPLLPTASYLNRVGHLALVACC